MTGTYKYFLFDWDGCLADTLSNAKRIYEVLAKEKGIDFTDDMFKQVVGDWDRSAAAVGYGDVTEFKHEYSQLVQDSIKDVGFNKNAKEILQWLKESGVSVGVVTSSSRHWIIEQATEQGVINFISHVVGYEDVTNTKPDPEPIYKLMGIMGANPRESVMIGDTEKDIIAAARAGIDSVLYELPEHKEVYGEMEYGEYKPTRKITDFIELKQYSDLRQN